MYRLIAIAVAGAIGALLRFGVANGVHRFFGRDFPYGTLVVNVTGSVLIGYLFVVFLERSLLSDTMRIAVLVGLLGSFTTFSTFSLETVNLAMSGNVARASVNIVVSVVLCLFGTVAGMALARM